MKKILIQLSILLVSFLLIDFLFGNFFFNKKLKNNVYDINKSFLYNFKKNLDIKNYNYGNKNYRLCTNNLGAIDDCYKKNITTKKIDYVFIGDSFVEGLGVEFKDTFFGLLKNKYPNKQFLNLAVSGYSTSIYYNKLKYFYEDGFKFSEIYIFLDTSDIFDEIYRYKGIDEKISLNLNNDQINDLLDGKKKLIKNIYNNLPGTFLLISLVTDLLSKLSFIENNYIDLMINHNFGKWSYGQSNLYSKKAVNESLKKNSNYVSKIIEITKKNKSNVTFVLYPWPGHIFQEKTNNRYNNYWTNFFSNKDISLINLNLEIFDLLEKNTPREIILKYYIHGDIHFNLTGHNLIFKNLDKILNKN